MICRLALKAFTNQKRPFFLHLEDKQFGRACNEESGVSKKHCSSLGRDIKNKLRERRTLSAILTNLE